MTVKTPTQRNATKRAALAPALATLDDVLNMSVVPTGKRAEANTEQNSGIQEGSSTHPTTDAEDHTEDAPEGEQSADNAKQVKEQIGEASVDATPDPKSAALRIKAKLASAKKADSVAPPGTPGTADADQLQIGTKKTPTGEAPESETSSAGAIYPDPGTDHPAKTTNDSLNGGKYAAMSVAQLRGEFTKVANAYVDAVVESDASAPAAGQKTASSGKPQADAKTAAAAGSAVADAVIDDQPHYTKAAYEYALGQYAGIVDQAHRLGSRLADHYDGIRAKHAADQQANTATGRARAKVAKAVRKNADDGSGGPPPGADAGGPPPAADAGGPPVPEHHGDEGGGDVNPEELMMILQQLGLTPEDLEQMAAEQGGAHGGGDAGGAPPGGGMPPEMAGAGAPPPGGGMTVSAADKARQKVASAVAKKKLAGALSKTAQLLRENVNRSK